MEVSLDEWTAGWRSLSHLEAVDVKIGEFVVMHVRRYDRETHSNLRAVFTPVRMFDDKVTLYSRRTFELGIRRVILSRGQPRIIMYPAAGALATIALSEDSGQENLLHLIRETYSA